MDKRQKILAAIVIVVLVGFVLDKFVMGPWSDAMADSYTEIQRLKSENSAAEKTARQETEVTAEWKALKDRLTAVKSEEASNLLASQVDKLIRKHGLSKSSLSAEPPVPVVGSPAFKEHFLALSFQCPWDSFVKLLVDLYAADEFVRIHRLGVQSHYLVEKESYLDVNLRLSTVSAAPIVSKK